MLKQMTFDHVVGVGANQKLRSDIGGLVMLVLSRKSQQAVVVSSSNGLEHLLKIIVLDVHRGNVKLGFEATGLIIIDRLEVWERIYKSNLRDAHSPPKLDPS